MQQTKAGQRLIYIDGLKGMLCFLIMLGHFWNIYAMRKDPGFSIPLLEAVAASPLLCSLLDATFWLYGFLAISGFLLSSSRIGSLFQLLLKSFLRYLRLFLPILGACGFIYLLQQLVGFHAGKTAAYFTCPWFQGSYDVPFSPGEIWSEAVRAMSDGFCRFNDPFWVIRDIFRASLLIYLCRYTRQRLGKGASLIPLLLLAAAGHREQFFLCACLCGYLTGNLRELFQRHSRSVRVLLGAAAAALLLSADAWDRILFNILFWTLALMILQSFSRLQNPFCGPLFRKLGQLSFGIYAFHWPVICSFGALTLLAGFEKGLEGGTVFLLALTVSVAATLVLSVLYCHTVEKLSSRCILLISRAAEKAEERLRKAFRSVLGKLLPNR